jgi:hypothetical protein
MVGWARAASTSRKAMKSRCTLLCVSPCACSFNVILLLLTCDVVPRRFYNDPQWTKGCFAKENKKQLEKRKKQQTERVRDSSGMFSPGMRKKKKVQEHIDWKQKEKLKNQKNRHTCNERTPVDVTCKYSLRSRRHVYQ